MQLRHFILQIIQVIVKGLVNICIEHCHLLLRFFFFNENIYVLSKRFGNICLQNSERARQELSQIYLLLFNNSVSSCIS